MKVYDVDSEGDENDDGKEVSVLCVPEEVSQVKYFVTSKKVHKITKHDLIHYLFHCLLSTL